LKIPAILAFFTIFPLLPLFLCVSRIFSQIVSEVRFFKEISLATRAAEPVKVEIYDQVYNLRGTDAEYISKLAEYVDTKMRTVAEQTATIDSLRLAVLAALNIADEYHLLRKKYDLLAGEYRQRAGQLSGALDEVLEESRRIG
jgi:cell division protein ZapA